MLTRDPVRAQHLRGVAEIRTGDIRQRASLTAAVSGAESVVSAVHGFVGPGRVTPDSVDRRGNIDLIDLAAAQSASVILVSVVGAAVDSPFELSRAKYSAEAHLRAAGTPWTIVRASPFLETWVEILSKGVIFGRGMNPVNFVSVHDVAAAVVESALRPEWRGEVLEVGGQDMTLNELAALVEELAPRSRRYRHVPRGMLRVLAPLLRPARAALIMDTTDVRPPTALRPADLPLTDVRDAVSFALMASRSEDTN